jgi:hypothetical protein
MEPHESVVLNFSPFVWFPSVFVNPVFLREGRACFIIQLSPFYCVPFWVLGGMFLVIADAHLLTGCMALQTARSVMIAVCEGQLAWAVWHCRPFAIYKGQLACRRCSPSILKKWNLTNLSSWISHRLFDFYLVKVSSYWRMAESFFFPSEIIV